MTVRGGRRTPANGGIPVAIADDHELFRAGLQALLGSIADVEVIGEAADAEGALRIAVRDRPQVLLLDIRMPDVDGLEALRRIRAAAPDVAIVMLTMIKDSEVLATAIRAGAVGYVLKDAEQEELLHVIQAAARGELLFGASVADRARLLIQRRAGPWAPPLPELSERERSILDQLAADASIAQIARTLHLSEKSVRNYLTVIPRRLDVADRAGSIARAREAGLGR